MRTKTLQFALNVLLATSVQIKTNYLNLVLLDGMQSAMETQTVLKLLLIKQLPIQILINTTVQVDGSKLNLGREAARKRQALPPEFLALVLQARMLTQSLTFAGHVQKGSIAR